MDLDYFKDVNDNFGHQRGDEVLCSVADVLRSCVRTTDLLVRMGGDEFLVVLDNTDNRMVQIIQSNSVRMNTTIESVLNLSRKKDPRRETIQLKSWLQDFTNDFVMQSKLGKHQINLFVEPADAEIQFDSAHLHQVLWNLCRNSEKYAKQDIENLHIDIQGSHPRHTRDIMLNIMDNGKGIPEEDVERLFEPFFTTSTKGTGLGLFMARELCLSNGCSLEYVKLPAGGSCFRLIFSQAKLES